MNFLSNLFQKRNPSSAQTAKERLQIIISHERSKRSEDELHFLPELREELLQVVRKYIKVNDEQIHVEVGKNDSKSKLELNITFPEQL